MPNSVVIFVSYSVTPTVREICRPILKVDLSTFLLVLCFTLVFEGLWYKENFKVEYSGLTE